MSTPVQARETVVKVDPAELTPHPANPRRDLGDLGDLIASVEAHGVLEPVVVLPVATVVQAWPEHAGLVEESGADYVTLLGHRRVAAAQTAVLEELMVILRHDLTTADAQLSAMTAENVARANLSPLEEANAFHALASRGWPQRRIAAELGCAQSHVSKRLKLLRLPEQLRAAIAGGELDVTDGLKLGTLPDHDSVLSAWQRLREEREDEFGDSTDVDYVVEQQQRQADEAAQEQAARNTATAEGIEVIDDPRKRFGATWWNHQLDEASTERARRNGELVYAIGYAGDLVPYTTRPPERLQPADDSIDRGASSQAANAREQRRATKAREQACPGLVAALPAADQLQDALARAILERETPDANAMKLASRWLAAAGIGPTVKDHHKWAAAMAQHGDAQMRAHAAWAGLVAAEESRTRAPYRHWDHRDVAYLELLQEHGYEPTPWERARLAEVRRNAQDADRLRLCANLSCTLDAWHTGSCGEDSTESAVDTTDREKP